MLPLRAKSPDQSSFADLERSRVSSVAAQRTPSGCLLVAHSPRFVSGPVWYASTGLAWSLDRKRETVRSSHAERGPAPTRQHREKQRTTCDRPYCTLPAVSCLSVVVVFLLVARVVSVGETVRLTAGEGRRDQKERKGKERKRPIGRTSNSQPEAQLAAEPNRTAPHGASDRIGCGITVSSPACLPACLPVWRPSRSTDRRLRALSSSSSSGPLQLLCSGLVWSGLVCRGSSLAQPIWPGRRVSSEVDSSHPPAVRLPTMATQPPDEDVHMVEVAPGLSVPTTEQYNISSPPVPRAAATAAAAPDASAAGEDADATMHGDGEEEVDDDALIEAAFKETGLEAPLRSPAMKSSAAASAQQMDVGDDEDGDTDDEDLLNPFSAAAIAAAAKAVKPPVEGETYVSETGEVLRRRAKKKKVVVELSEEEKAAELQAKKEATERAENLLKDLLKKADEVLRRTMMGGGQLATAAATKQKKGKKDEGPRRKTEKEEDDELLDDLEEDTLPNGAVQLRAQPSIVTGQMRAYQLEGLQWMIKLYHAGVSGILADEMGLGKTLQSISLLAYLRHYQKVNGPHLVLVPLSTLGNWHREFERWCPSIRCFKFHGTREERAKMVADGMLQPENWDVLLTSYEMSIREKASVSKVKWNFIVIDEAHRLKNEGSLLSQIVRIFSSRNRLLLTGTRQKTNSANNALCCVYLSAHSLSCVSVRCV
jgi:hypothetical protein